MKVRFCRDGELTRTLPEARAPGASRTGLRLRSAVESGVLTGLLLAVVVSAMTASHTLLLCALVGAWVALAAIVGARSALDAGCAFMLLAIGVILVVDLAANGFYQLLP